MHYDQEYKLGIRLAANRSAMAHTTDREARAALALRIRDINRELRGA